MRQIDWDDLRVFLEIGRLKSLGLASKRLHLDHSTVSRRLARLEQTLGKRLLDRKPDGVVLNQAGRDLMLYSEAMESQLMAAHTAFDDRIDAMRETVRLSTYEGIASLYIASKLNGFEKQNPNIDLEITTGMQPVRVDRRDADLFLSFYKPEGRSLHTELAGVMNLFLFAAADYLKERGIPTTTEQLKDHRFVTYIPDYITVDTARWLDEVIESPRANVRSTSMITQMNAAAHGCGLVLLPAFCPTEKVGLKPVLLRKIRVERPIWISAHKDLLYLPKVKKLMKFLKQTIADDAAFLTGERFRVQSTHK
jgi:DNA-binding transcriptional LysR family regulator